MALEAEMGKENIAAIAERCDVHFIGMGKLNAFEATMRALAQGEYECVINAGTCGSSSHPFGSTLYPEAALQGDVYIDPEGLFFTPAEHLGTGDEGCTIVSSDNFIGDDTPERQRTLLAPYDCMDMEAYAALKAKFMAGLDNDINTSLGVTAIYDVLKAKTNDATKLAAIADFDRVLSLNLLQAANALKEKQAKDEAQSADPEVDALVAARTAAKKEKNFAEADRIRDLLKDMGVEIIDTPQGTKWRKV